MIDRRSRRPRRTLKPWEIAGFAGFIIWALLVNGAPPVPAQTGAVLIGGIGPLSQPGAVSAGLDMKWAMEAAVADVNAKGGVLGRKLELEFEDTQATPATAVAVAKKLIEEKKASIVVGEYHSSAALAAIPVYSAAGMPVVFVETAANGITAGDPTAPNLPPNPKTIFRTFPASAMISAIIGEWLGKGLRAKKIAHIYEASDYGASQKTVLKSQMDAENIKITQVQVELNQSDYSSVLQRLAQTDRDADAIVLDTTGEANYILTQNAFATGLIKKGTACVANQVAANATAFWRVVPDGVGCVFRFTGPLPGKAGPVGESVASRYQAKFSQQPKPWVYESYDAVLLAADAIARAKSTDHAAIVRALETANFKGVLGTYSFPYNSANAVPAGQAGWRWHQWLTPPMTLLEYTKKGQPLADAVTVWPEDRQTTKGRAYVTP